MAGAIAPQREGNAIAMATVPTWDKLWARAPRTLLAASEEAVGLPCGQMGNSEVGHLNLGAGRVVKQDLVRINDAIKDGSFFTNPVFVDACRRVKANGGTLHLVGLIGAGGVHAIDTHLLALLDLAEREGVPRVAIQVMLDGRDTMPRSGLGYLEELIAKARGRAVIGSVGGRYFGMDRDHRWERTEKWYDSAVRGTGPSATDPLQVVRDAYGRDVTDEFVVPTAIVDDAGKPVAPMRDGDAVICFNYRSDRMRQIVRSLTVKGFDGFDVRDRPEGDRCDDDGVRPDLRGSRRLPAAVDGADRRRGGVGGGPHHAAHGGNREVRARDLLLQRRARDAVQGGGSPARAESEGGDVRSGPRDERTRHHRRALLGHHGEGARLHPVQLRERRHGRPHGQRAGRDQGGGDGGPVPGPRARRCRRGGGAGSSSRRTMATAR